MKNKLAVIICVFIFTNAHSQSVETVKTYYDNRTKTQIKEIYSVIKNTSTKHGTYKKYEQNGILSEVKKFSNGIKNGIFKSYDGKGRQLYMWTYAKGELHGVSEEYHYTNIKKQLQWQGEYKNAVLIKQTKYYLNGNKSLLEQVNGICNTWYENGKKNAEYYCKNALVNGKYLKWYENGAKWEEGNFINTTKNGKWLIFSKKGDVIRTEFWKDDIKMGEWKIFFNEEWKLVEDITEARYYRIINFDDSGSKDLVNYSKSSNNFKTSDYFISGEKQWEGYCHTQKGKMHFDECVFTEVGSFNYYYKNGKVKLSGIFMHNHKPYKQAKCIKDGIWKFYDEQGQLEQIETFKCTGNSMGYTSKLMSIKDKKQIEQEKLND